jgi:hypothetical protein
MVAYGRTEKPNDPLCKHWKNSSYLHLLYHGMYSFGSKMEDT